MSTRPRLLSLALAVMLAGGCASHRSPVSPAAQLRFGVNMAQKGLWSEALFRFQEAQRMSGDRDPQVLNNLAVASEALGKFDDALGYYKKALQLDPGNAALKNNYDRFVSFYESFRARGEEKGPKTAPKDPNAPAADNGTPGPSQPAVTPPTSGTTAAPALPPLGGAAPPGPMAPGSGATPPTAAPTPPPPPVPPPAVPAPTPPQR